MIALPLLAALLAMNVTTPYPQGFKAKCNGGVEGWGYFNPDHPAPRLLQADDNGETYEFSQEDGKWVVLSYGADVINRMQDGNEWKVQVLKQVPGELVLSMTTSTFGASISICHLHFKGATGQLSVSTTRYYDAGGSDMATLTILGCKIQGTAGVAAPHR